MILWLTWESIRSLGVSKSEEGGCFTMGGMEWNEFTLSWHHRRLGEDLEIKVADG